MKILDRREITLKNKNPLITFSTTGGDRWKEWDRYIEVENEKAFHIGNICGTCNFFFKKLDGSLMKFNSKKMVEALKFSDMSNTDNIIKKIGSLFESGDYIIIKSEIKPVHTIPFSNLDYFSKEIIDMYGIQEFSGLPFYPGTTYYRDEERVMDEESKQFSFYIPMVPDSWLNQETIHNYENQIQNGIKPVCISIAVLDKKQSVDCPKNIQYSTHYCFANYLIDGHHKIKAASNLKKETDLISFLNIGKGISSIDEIHSVFNIAT